MLYFLWYDAIGLVCKDFTIIVFNTNVDSEVKIENYWNDRRFLRIWRFSCGYVCIDSVASFICVWPRFI